MSEFLLRKNTIFLIIWIALMLYGFYKYYKRTDFRKISFGHFIALSLSGIISGFITGMFIIDCGFVLLMLFTGLIIEVGKYYLVEKTRQVSMLLSVYFIAVIVSYFVATRCKNSFLSKMFTICFLMGLFVLGAKGFFYYLTHDFRK
jgi:uncharacterized membrane protein